MIRIVADGSPGLDLDEWSVFRMEVYGNETFNPEVVRFKSSCISRGLWICDSNSIFEAS